MTDIHAFLDKTRNIDFKIAALKLEKRSVMGEFKCLLTERLKTHYQLFKTVRAESELFDGCDDYTVTAIRSTRETLEITMGHGFRGEWHESTIEFPIQYLLPGGEALMEKDAKAEIKAYQGS